jgi:DNA repair protein SbcC/Rad50
VSARGELDRQLAELDAAAKQAAAERRDAEASRERASTLRVEREHVVRELKLAAGYEHARTELVEGEACPLCGATEHPWRDRGALAEVIRDAEARLAEVAGELDRATEALARIAAGNAQRERERARTTAGRTTIDDSARTLVASWREQLSALGELMLVDEPATDAALALADDRIAAARKRFEEARATRSQTEAATKAAQDAQAQIQTWQANLEQIAGKLGEVDRKLAELDAAIERVRGEREARVSHHREVTREIDAAVARWTAVVPAGDLLWSGVPGTHDAQRLAMAALVASWHQRAAAIARADAAIEHALGELDRALRDGERALAEHGARRDDAQRRESELARELSDATARLDDARRAAGFDPDELRRLLAPRADTDADRARTDGLARIEALAAHLEALDRAVETARAIVAERRRLVDEHAVAEPADLADAAHVDALAAAVAEADHHAARLAATLAADADARVRRDTALAELATAESAADVDRMLGEVIGSHDGKLFRSFAQSLTLDSLLAVANGHLEELAPRYQLERVPKHDLEIQVIDRDLGSEVRSVQSLSGGESFLVSLALALGLSSMSAHDVRVRTLLIDEGFGTLDPSTLDSALAVLDALQATGRQVGVISHVPALVERVGAHVRVVQRGGGRSEVIVADG